MSQVVKRFEKDSDKEECDNWKKLLWLKKIMIIEKIVIIEKDCD